MTDTLPVTHPSLGLPDKIYPYRDGSGMICAASYRFDNKDGKTVRPYCTKQQDWKSPIVPILYDLEALASRPDEPVIVVEGEKCADALAGFGYLATTSMGGSNAAHKTDWSPLRGREVILWPDNDTPGEKYADSICTILHTVGATVRRISLRNVTYVTLGLASYIRKYANDPMYSYTEGQPTYTCLADTCPQGWDAADAIAAGWTKETLSKLLEHAETIVPPASNTQTMKLPHTATERVDRVGLASNDNWPKPDMSILETKAPKPSLPLNVFHPRITDWISKAAEGCSAPPEYVAGSLLSACATLIGNSRKASPWAGWSEPSILWLALVGDPSSGKSPAMEPVLDLLRTLEADMVPIYEEALRAYETDKQEAALIRQNWEKDIKTAQAEGGGVPMMPQAAVEPRPPERQRLTMGDATSEALCLAMQGNPKGFLNVRDELTGLFANLDRYAGSKGGDRALYLEAYGGKSFTQDRVKNGEPLKIDHLSLSMLGGMQPDKIESLLMKGDDDGLSARILYIHPDKVERRRPRSVADRDYMLGVFRRLHALTLDKQTDGQNTPRIVPFSTEAADIFDAWWHNNGKHDHTGRFGGWLGKTPGMVIRLALVLEYVSWAADATAPEPYEISDQSVRNALTLMDDYFIPMAKHIYHVDDQQKTNPKVRLLAKWIRENKPERISVRDLQRTSGLSALGNAESITDTCLELMGHAWL
ncbi:DUF3987 domain-containing protein, partial [Kordiimonas sediminis]|uniref:DUF3987 domain-containing protein n=1 Tax=Kordiimonas sediminis TaxID=1735581 RepID=UPI00174CF49A